MAASATHTQQFIDLIDAIHIQAETARYLAISGVALLLYDWLTTLDKEIEYAWARKWSFARVVFHLNRLLPLLLIGVLLTPYILFAPASFTTLTCKKLILTYSYGVVVLLVINCTTSIIRCWALYGQKWVLWVLIPGLVVTVGHAVLHITLNIEKTFYLANPIPDILQGCLVKLPNGLWLAYFSGVIYETVVFGMVVWRIWCLGNGLSLTPLMRQMLKCGIVFFGVNLVVMLFSCIGSAYHSTIIIANGSGLLTALSSVMCSRIFFSMHEFASQDQIYVSSGMGLTTGAGGANITGQFAIPMTTLSIAPSGPHVSFGSASVEVGSVGSKGKETYQGSDAASAV